MLKFVSKVIDLQGTLLDYRPAFFVSNERIEEPNEKTEIIWMQWLGGKPSQPNESDVVGSIII